MTLDHPPGALATSDELPTSREGPRCRDTFCVVPYTSFIVLPDGTGHPCNKMYNYRVTKDGSTLSIYQNPLDEMWNGNEMRGIRRDMAEGRRVAACQECYDLEASGGRSQRVNANALWEAGHLREEGLTFNELKARATAAGFRLQAPRALQLDVSNACNLKCRMCTGGASSSIAADPVHSRWRGGASPVPAGGHWSRQKALIGGILNDTSQLVNLHLIGGEPFLVKEVGNILQRLIDADAASRIDLAFHTNATTVDPPWLPLLRHFRSVTLWVSIDGFGRGFEYIRFPARWDQLVRNLEVLKGIAGNIRLNACVIAQAYNVLNLVDLLSFCDSIGLPFYLGTLYDPPYLRTTILPAKVRLLAAQRLRAYAELACAPSQRESVLSHASHLEGTNDGDEELLQEFFLFTRDLDMSRGQSLKEAFPELFDLIGSSAPTWAATNVLDERGLPASQCRKLEAGPEPRADPVATLRAAARLGWRTIKRGAAAIKGK